MITTPANPVCRSQSMQSAPARVSACPGLLRIVDALDGGIPVILVNTQNFAEESEDRIKKLEPRSGEEAQVASRLASLSERERQVLEGLVAGHANKVIAQELGISPRTVEVYRANLMTKMQAKSLSELIRMTLAIGRPD